MINSIGNIPIKELPVKDILKAIIGIFKIPDVPPPPIDPLTIQTSLKNPGLSPRKIAAEIIARQSEAGAPFGPLPSGAANVAEKMELIRVQEITKAIQQDARTIVSIPPGITSIGFISMPPLPPIPVISFTTTPAHIAPAIIS
jgi:hypothetical protein